jgi:DNA-binding IclR family transcriptional regulator
MSEDKKETSSSIQTVEHIGNILHCFTETEDELGVMSISRATGLHKSTVSRLLSSLQNEGFVNKNPDTGKYQLGLGLVNLAGLVLERLNLRDIAQAPLRGLAEHTKETINLTVVNSGECINVESIRSPKSIQYAGQLGRRTPLHCTSTGKVLLAYMDAQERKRVLAPSLTAYTPQTITDHVVLEEDILEKVRQQGYAVAQEEYEEGLSAIAAPIRDHTGAVIAAVSISGPSYRMTPETTAGYISPLLEAAERISAKLGYIPDT